LNIGLQLTQNSQKYNNLLSLLKDNLDNEKSYNFINLPNRSQLEKYFKELDILVCYKMNKNLFTYSSEKLKWIHFGAAGIDGSLFQNLLKSKVIITTSSGINSDAVAEYVLGGILYSSKRFNDCYKFMQSRKWNQWDIVKNTFEIKNKTLGIIGYGNLGKAIAKRAKAFGMNIIATRRLQKKKENKKFVDELLPINDIEDLFSNSDFIVIACPLTPNTLNLIGNNEFNKMKSSVIIINPARGPIINQKALENAIKYNKISGAILDVFQKEPLNENSSLFDLDNVFLTPHISGNFPGYQNKVIELFSKNLNRYINNKTLINRVCKKRLY
tara:strand:- start:833 stop:1816 length:984 start_codon:yes stop_codon:yes gene_type:complete